MSGSLSPPPEEDALITLVLVDVVVVDVPFRLADKEVVEPHRGAHTNEFCVVVIIITHTLGKCYSLSLSLSLSRKTIPCITCGRSCCSSSGVFVRRACATLSLSFSNVDTEWWKSFIGSLPNIVSLTAPRLMKKVDLTYETYKYRRIRVRKKHSQSQILSERYRLVSA